VLFSLFMNSVGLTETTIFLKLQLVRSGPFIFGGTVIATFAIGTAQMDNLSHRNKPLFEKW
jgi:hypothetical protein